MALELETENYEIRVRSAKGVFQMWIPDLILYSEGTSRDAAFSEIVKSSSLTGAGKPVLHRYHPK